MTQFAPPPGYAPDSSDSSQQPVQAQPAQTAQPVQQPSQSSGGFAPPPGYVPTPGTQPTAQPVQPAAQATQPTLSIPPLGQETSLLQGIKNRLTFPTGPAAPPNTAPPTDHKEQLAYAVAGVNGLQLYRFARNTVDRVESLIEADPKDYPVNAANLKAHINTATAIGEGEEAQGTGQQTIGRTVVYPAVRQAIKNVGTNIRSTVAPTPEEQQQMLDQPIVPPPPGIAATAAEFAAEEAATAGARAAAEKGATAEAATAAKAAKDAKAAQEQAAIAHKEIRQAIPSTKSTPYEDKSMDVAEAYAEQHHAGVEPIRSVKDFVDATDHSVKAIEDRISELIDVAPDDKITGVLDDVKKQLGTNERGKEFVDAGLKEVEGLNLDNMTTKRADAVRRQLNAENEGILQKNKYDRAAARASDPGFAAREAAANSLRAKTFENLAGRGIEGAEQLREDEGHLLSVRDAGQAQLENGNKIVKGSSEAGFGARVAAKTVKGAVKIGGATLGNAVAGPVGALAGGEAAGELGETLANKIASPDITRDAVIERRFNRPPVTTFQPAEAGLPKGVQAVPEPTPPAGTQSTIPGVGQGHVPATPAASTLTPAQGDLFGTPATPPAALQSPQAELTSLKAAMRPLQAVLNDPMATAAEKAEASRKLANLPLADLQNAAVPSAGKEAAGAADIKLPAEEGVQEAPLDVPANRVQRGEGTVEEKSSRARDNEWGHVIVGHKMGFTPEEIISHNHESIAHTRIAAETRISAPMIPEGKNGLSTDEAIADHLDKVLTTVMAGPAANEVHSGLTLAENPMSHGDLGFAKKVVKEAGLSPEAGQAKIDAAYDKAKNILTEEHAHDILREYSDTREPGLDKRYHASRDRIKEATDELDRRQNARND